MHPLFLPWSLTGLRCCRGGVRLSAPWPENTAATLLLYRPGTWGRLQALNPTTHTHTQPQYTFITQILP